MELSQSKETWIHFSQEPMTACGVTLCLQTPQTVAVGWLAPGHLSSREQPAPCLSPVRSHTPALQTSVSGQHRATWPSGPGPFPA